MELSTELSKLAELHSDGRLTDEEYSRAKQRLLAESTRCTDHSLGCAVNGFRRSRDDRWLAGVCGGIAKATGMETWIWRLLFAAMFIVVGAGALLYVLLWFFVPSENMGSVGVAPSRQAHF